MNNFFQKPEVVSLRIKLGKLIATYNSQGRFSIKQKNQIQKLLNYFQSLTDIEKKPWKFVKNRLKNISGEISDVLIEMYYIKAEELIKKKLTIFTISVEKMPSLYTFSQVENLIKKLFLKYNIRQEFFSKEIIKINNIILLKKDEVTDKFIRNNLKVYKKIEEKLFKKAGLDNKERFELCVKILQKEFKGQEYNLLKESEFRNIVKYFRDNK